MINDRLTRFLLLFNETIGEDYEKRVSAVYEQVRYSGLSESVRNDYGQSYLDFVMEFGTSAARYNQLEADIKAPSVYVAQSRKRAAAAAEQAEEEERTKKQRQEEAEAGEEKKHDVAMDGQAQASSEHVENDGAVASSDAGSGMGDPTHAQWAGPASGYSYPPATGVSFPFSSFLALECCRVVIVDWPLMLTFFFNDTSK